LAAESHRKDQQNSRLQKTIDDQGERLDAMQLTLDNIQSSQEMTRDENIKLNAQLLVQGRGLKSMQIELKKALREADKYKGLYEVLRDEKFIGSNQKKRKSTPASGRDDDKDDWDGTGNAGDDEFNSETGSATEPEAGKENKENSEHFCSDSANTISGTQATVDMLVELVFNAYMLETPVYRDMIRLFELKFKVSRQTILNWLSKGSIALKKLLPVLKAQALEKDSIINCDETWCRVKMQDKYKKAYIWCLVNKSAGFIATCKMGALSFYQFLKQYLTAFMEGRTDFENLTPAILGKIN
jgi:hypothetical protein